MPPLVFTHIPKAAGSATYAALIQALSPRAPLAGFDHAIFGGFEAFDSLSPDQRADIYAGPEQLPADADLVGGHFAWSTTRRAYPGARHMTLLREPVTRVLSQWAYWRAQADAALAGWGSWAARVRTAHQPLAVFLDDPAAACQSDNLAVRMLLWPHPLIPGDGFIAAEHDAVLSAEALDRLRGYDHVDIVENPGLERRLSHWIGRDFTMIRANETGMVPVARRTILHEEMTPQALDLIEDRSRLDLVLWRHAAAAVLPADRVETLRVRSIVRAVARHAYLLGPEPDRAAGWV